MIITKNYRIHFKEFENGMLYIFDSVIGYKCDLLAKYNHKKNNTMNNLRIS